MYIEQGSRYAPWCIPVVNGNLKQIALINFKVNQDRKAPGFIGLGRLYQDAHIESDICLIQGK